MTSSDGCLLLIEEYFFFVNVYCFKIFQYATRLFLVLQNSHAFAAMVKNRHNSLHLPKMRVLQALIVLFKLGNAACMWMRLEAQLVDVSLCNSGCLQWHIDLMKEYYFEELFWSYIQTFGHFNI